MRLHGLVAIICAIGSCCGASWPAPLLAQPYRMSRVTAAQRQAAADRAAAARAALGRSAATTAAQPASAMGKAPGLAASRASAAAQTATPDYFGVIPNFANSPRPQRSCSTTTTLCVADDECPSGETCTRVVPGTGIRKFVDTLPGLGPTNANNLGQYIPVATPIWPPPAGVPDDGDYYELGAVQFAQQLHPDLPSTHLRGYTDLNPAAPGGNAAHYLGPFIIAQKDRPVRIKLTNLLPTGALGNLSLPVDTTVMGAGTGPDGTHAYTQNRVNIHLHGGNTPWISDGTPHQWTVPAGESTPYKKGVSTVNVPDMPDPGDGGMTYYFPNQQSGRFMFFHDHVYGLTRLNLYAGLTSGYLLTDPVEDGLIDAGVLPGRGDGLYRYGIPLVIQDKTFVPDAAALAAEDPTWSWGGLGDLWFPHVYMPNQNPFDDSGTNAMGRWDYGPWFWPPYTGLTHGPVPNPYFDPVAAPWEPADIPGTPNPSIVPEAFMDTPLVNGAAYPVLRVERRAYRFRILNACNDRFLNLQLYYVDPDAPTEVRMVPAFRYPGTPLCSASVTSNCWPATWPVDNRDGGVPDPGRTGPPLIQIGTESGLLPAPVVIPPQPVNFVYNRRDIVVLNVSDHALLLGPAERADVVVDFSQIPEGAQLILYNDAPAPVPAADPRVDYYTGNPDQTDTGGAPTTLPGYGPNTRTIMRFDVGGSASAAFDLAALRTAFASSNSARGAFATAQDHILVAESAYNSAYNKTYKNSYARIQNTSLTIVPISADGSPQAPTTVPMQPKAIQELFDPEYGRMNSTLGVEVPNTSATVQTTIPYSYIDPPTELLRDGEVQIWKVTHNGVDTHAVHFHLFSVQLINRVGWDGAVRPPDPNELGWKETVRMNPLEDAIVALRPLRQDLPWPLPDSVRPLNVTMPVGSRTGFTNVDPNGNPITVVNTPTNFGWEYVWHCHLLGHEENDMMRPMVFQIPPEPPSALAGDWGLGGAHLRWTDNCASETSFTLERALDAGFTLGRTALTVPPVQPNSRYGESVDYTDTTAAQGTRYYYRVAAAKLQTALLPPQDATTTATSPWVGPVRMAAAAAAAVAPTAVAFGTQTIGTVSSARTVTLSNTGSLPLAIGSIALSGTNAADFAQSNTCGASLAAPVAPATATSCTITLTFSPAAVGARTASLTIAVSDPVHPTLAVALGGTGVRPIVGVSSLAVAFGTQLISTSSAAQTVTVSNTGNGALQVSGIVLGGANSGDFAQSTTCGNGLAPPVAPATSTSCAISVTFRPTALGTRAATLTINSNDPTNPHVVVSLSGAGTALSLSATALSFAPQLVGTSSVAQTVTLSNGGTTSVAITGIAAGGTNAADFTVANNCGATLAAARSCTITVRFAPTASGARAATVSIRDSDPTSPQSVVLAGTAIAPVLSVSSTALTFNSPLNVRSAAQTITVSNPGSSPLMITGIALAGTNANQFAQTNTCGTTVLTGMSCTISLTFTPTSASPLSKSASLTIGVAAPATSQSVSLSGAVVVPTYTLSPASLAFASQTARTTSSPQTVTVTNTGSLALTISSVALSGSGANQFAQSKTCGATLASGATCAITVTFTPTSAGAKSAQLTVNVAAPATTQSVALSGTGK